MGDMVPWVRKPEEGLVAYLLAAPQFTTAELATWLGVDEGQLACLLLKVRVVGQALLSLFSVEVGEGMNGQTACHNL